MDDAKPTETIPWVLLHAPRVGSFAYSTWRWLGREGLSWKEQGIEQGGPLLWAGLLTSPLGATGGLRWPRRPLVGESVRVRRPGHNCARTHRSNPCWWM